MFINSDLFYLSSLVQLLTVLPPPRSTGRRRAPPSPVLQRRVLRIERQRRPDSSEPVKEDAPKDRVTSPKSYRETESAEVQKKYSPRKVTKYDGKFRVISQNAAVENKTLETCHVHERTVVEGKSLRSGRQLVNRAKEKASEIMERLSKQKHEDSKMPCSKNTSKTRSKESRFAKTTRWRPESCNTNHKESSDKTSKLADGKTTGSKTNDSKVLLGGSVKSTPQSEWKIDLTKDEEEQGKTPKRSSDVVPTSQQAVRTEVIDLTKGEEKQGKKTEKRKHDGVAVINGEPPLKKKPVAVVSKSLDSDDTKKGVNRKQDCSRKETYEMEVDQPAKKPGENLQETQQGTAPLPSASPAKMGPRMASVQESKNVVVLDEETNMEVDIPSDTEVS